ncbi:MAG: hypothetical protein WCW65_00555 [Candidatus Paceibacterota bacterium]
MPEEDKKHNLFLYILLAGVIITILSSFYFFYFKKDYDFIVETQCNPETETCFYRDCESSPDDCPPNGLSYYNTYTLKASDFKSCVNEDCTEACTAGTINCIKTECTETDINDEVCVVPNNLNLEAQEPEEVQ